MPGIQLSFDASALCDLSVRIEVLDPTGLESSKKQVLFVAGQNKKCKVDKDECFYDFAPKTALWVQS